MKKFVALLSLLAALAISVSGCVFVGFSEPGEQHSEFAQFAYPIYERFPELNSFENVYFDIDGGLEYGLIPGSDVYVGYYSDNRLQNNELELTLNDEEGHLKIREGSVPLTNFDGEKTIITIGVPKGVNIFINGEMAFSVWGGEE